MSFTFKTDNVVVKTEGGQVMSQISAVKRQLHYGPDMDGGNKTCSQELIGTRIAKKIDGCILYGLTTTRRNGDDGEVLLKIKFDNNV